MSQAKKTELGIGMQAETYIGIEMQKRTLCSYVCANESDMTKPPNDVCFVAP